MTHLDNPAGRLYEILRGLRSYGNSGSVETAWVNVTGESAGSVGLHIAMYGVSKLLVDIHAELLALRDETDVDEYIECIPKWGRFVGMQDVKKQGVAFEADSVVTEPELTTLRAVSDMLHYRKSDAPLLTENIDSLDSTIRELIGNVIGNDEFDPDFRAFVLEHLQRAEEAIRYYRIYGPDRLDEVFGRFTAEAVRKPDLWTKYSETTVWQKIKAAFGALPFLAEQSDNVLKLGQNAQKFLELTSGNPPTP